MSGVPSELKSKRFIAKSAGRSLAALGAFSVVFGIIDNFFPDLLEDFRWIFWLGLVVSCIIGLRLAWPQPIEAKYSMPQTSVRILPGDLFDNEAASEHLIIGVSTSFDTRSPIIAPSSLQGQFLQRVYLNDAERLDADLAVALGPYGDEAEVIEGKVNGNKMAYPIGTTAVLQAPAGQHSFLHTRRWTKTTTFLRTLIWCGRASQPSGIVSGFEETQLW